MFIVPFLVPFSFGQGKIKTIRHVDEGVLCHQNLNKILLIE